jgi:hypothetical protein
MCNHITENPSGTDLSLVSNPSGLDLLGRREAEATANKMNDIKGRIENAPKTFRWKARAKIGKRKSWRRDIEDQEVRKTEIQEQFEERGNNLKWCGTI